MNSKASHGVVLKPTALDFRKSDILDLFRWTSSEYNDLTRERPTPKVGSKDLYEEIPGLKGRHFVEFNNDPFFTPIVSQRRGSGHGLALTFPDLMLLYLLKKFQNNGLERTYGRYIRSLAQKTLTKPLPAEEQIWSEWFEWKPSVNNWCLVLKMNMGLQDLELRYKDKKMFSELLYRDPDLGLVHRPSNIMFNHTMTLTIPLDEINETVKKMLKQKNMLRRG